MQMLGANGYTIEYYASVVKKDIPNLPTTAKQRIKKAIEERLQTNPMAYGKPLRYNLQGFRRLRVGDERVVYCIDPEKNIVQIAAIKHRKEIQEKSE